MAIAPFDRLVEEQVIPRPPYKEARRVFWIVDNCSVHRGIRAVERLRSRYTQLALVHAPVHASWLNPIEIYFSIVQRKVLKPCDRSRRPFSAGERPSYYAAAGVLSRSSGILFTVKPNGDWLGVALQ